jgi:hypothetical protein
MLETLRTPIAAKPKKKPGTEGRVCGRTRIDTVTYTAGRGGISGATCRNRKAGDLQAAAASPAACLFTTPMQANEGTSRTGVEIAETGAKQTTRNGLWQGQ